MKKYPFYILITLCAFFSDLLSKMIVNSWLRENESVPIIGNILKFTLVYNYGATFGFFGDYAPAILIITTKVITILLLLLLFFNTNKVFTHIKNHHALRICILSIIGGSLGNIFDRLADRRVTDFIDIGINGFRWHIFNVADIIQSVGVFLLLYLLIVNAFKQRAGHQTTAQ